VGILWQPTAPLDGTRPGLTAPARDHRNPLPETSNHATPMPKTYVIDIRHYLDDKGNLPPLPAPAMAIALFCGSIVSWVSGWPGPDGELTNVACRRSRSRPPCFGEVYAGPNRNREIEWRCRACGEEGTISGWRGTRWDRSARA